MKLIVWILLLVLAEWRIPKTESSECPYDFTVASRMIPPSCYQNSTDRVTSQGTCCWNAFASFVFAISRHANQTGEVLLDDAGSSLCTDEFVHYLHSRGLVRSTFFTNSSACQIDHLTFAANAGPCKYTKMAQIWDTVDLHNASRACNGPNLNKSNACDKCQSEVIDKAMQLLNVTNSKEFVPCGIAVTVGLWGPNPQETLFDSFVLCVTQVLQNVGTLGTSNLIPSPPPPPPPTIIFNKNPSDGAKRSRVRIGVSAGVAAAGAIVVIALVLLYIAKVKKIRRSDNESTAESTAEALTGIKSLLPTEGLYIFTKRELHQATAGFDPGRMIGQGGSAKVFLGNLPSGKLVAIKRIFKLQKRVHFYQEVQLLSRLQHPNLTALLGYCQHKNDHILVYEFMAGGDLSDLLYHPPDGHVLQWDHRLRIAVDCAEGLAYLHLFSEGAIIHRDVKPRNILLNSAGQAKLADFGISKLIAADFTHVTTEVKGTTGYLDPEYFSVGQLTEASDVYSFGVVLLELISGQKAIISTPSGGAESIVYATHVFNSRSDRNIRTLVDPRISDADVEAYVESIEIVLQIASLCVRPYRSERPSMVEVLKVLTEAWNKANDIALSQVNHLQEAFQSDL
ncbi:hypothetical protein SUGI_0776730 [Cryptomeria japonica]|nr:hypothetical protein SUGI_0776730 [Cryptomeria japonica]